MWDFVPHHELERLTEDPDSIHREYLATKFFRIQIGTIVLRSFLIIYTPLIIYRLWKKIVKMTTPSPYAQYKETFC